MVGGERRQAAWRRAPPCPCNQHARRPCRAGRRQAAAMPAAASSVGMKHEDRIAVRHQGHRPVQEFRAAEGLGVQVADFLQLERGLARDRERRAAPDGDKALRVAKRRERRAPVELEAAASRSGSRATASESAASSDHAATSRRQGRERGHKVLVAATLFSGPAPIGSTNSHSAASGESGALTMHAVSAPAAARAFAPARPDRRCGPIARSPAAIGPRAARRGDRRWRYWAPPPPPGCRDSSSIRCLPKVAACAEQPRAQVTTTCGGRASAARQGPRPAAKARAPGRHRLRRFAQLARHSAFNLAHQSNLKRAIHQ